MAEQKKKETRPTKPEGDDDAAGANPELAKKGKKIKVKKDKPPKMTPVRISRGTFTVDGVIPG